MIIRVSNKDTNRYRYTRRKIKLKKLREERSGRSFGDIFNDMQDLKERGIISSPSISIATKVLEKKW